MEFPLYMIDWYKNRLQFATEIIRYRLKQPLKSVHSEKVTLKQQNVGETSAERIFDGCMRVVLTR